MRPLTLRTLVTAAICAPLVLAGCSHHNGYYAQTPPPPPPPWASRTLVEHASANGFHDGYSDGERDVLAGYRYNARADQKFRVTPGYDERFGPYDLYRETYRDAYQRGYDNGFRRAEARAGR